MLGTQMVGYSRAQRLVAEAIGTAALLSTIVGSGIMAEGLASGNIAIALLANTIATGAMLVVLITALGPISGAHFNPAVTLAFAMRREIGVNEAGQFVVAQTVGGILGVFAAHAMFEESILQVSLRVRSGPGQWLAEAVATFGLVVTILGTLAVREHAVPWAVGLYIVAACWFTASTSFANPAVTIARALSDTFSGIRYADVPAFVACQIAGAIAATLLSRWLFQPTRPQT
ncbi:MAG: MIP/aquaporin family protein [Myxococcota bacterium]